MPCTFIEKRQKIMLLSLLLHKVKKFSLQDLSFGKVHHDHTPTIWADISQFHLEVNVFSMYFS